jgi:7-cyano-7-deazaguanine synthase
MQPDPSNGTIGLLLSGGLDSCILLGHLLERGHRVQPFYVRCGLAWETEEYAAMWRFLGALGQPRLAELVELEMPLADVYGSHWSVTGHEVPDADTPDEAVYLPGRNALLTIKAALWCSLHGIEQLALAVLRSNPFSDATGQFFHEFETALGRAVKGQIQIVRPLADFDKREVMRLGRKLPLKLSFSCIAPVDGQHCRVCNKCAERQAAFRLAEMADPTEYAEAVLIETQENGGQARPLHGQPLTANR